ncbi:hypothetical protein Leryth_010268 [Lithospermum erythrorhizon]|nr:hypothetical protein Leryth_010268 [Lithospermum erythrorhizon]
MEAGSGGGSPMQPSLPPPKPKSPPRYPDLYGKRKELAKVQMLEREIGYLQEELKFFDGIPPASQSCKEVADIVMAKPDPLIVKKEAKKMPLLEVALVLGSGCQFHMQCVVCPV